MFIIRPRFLSSNFERVMRQIGHARMDDVLAALNPSLFRILRHATLGKAIRSVAHLTNANGVELDRVAKTALLGDRGGSLPRRHVHWNIRRHLLAVTSQDQCVGGGQDHSLATAPITHDS